jgi:hypothetical protein
VTKDFSVTPKPQNKNAQLLMSAFFLIAIISLVITVFVDRYKGVVGLVTLGALITAILVYTKYVAVVFHYDVMCEGEDEPLFVVRQTVGKRNVTLCRVAFADFVGIKKESAAERRAHKTDTGVRKYVYTPSLSPAVSYRITVADKKERSEIIIEGTDELSEMLMRVSAEAKALRAELGEENE